MYTNLLCSNLIDLLLAETSMYQVLYNHRHGKNCIDEIINYVEHDYVLATNKNKGSKLIRFNCQIRSKSVRYCKKKFKVLYFHNKLQVNLKRFPPRVSKFLNRG